LFPASPAVAVEDTGADVTVAISDASEAVAVEAETLVATTEAPTDDDVETDGVVRADSLRVETAVLEAVERSNLRPLQKFRLRSLINSNLRPKVKQEILDTVTSQLIAADAITVTDDGAYFTQNWEEIIELILRFIPILLELLKLFG
jgi:hypothetical protein